MRPLCKVTRYLCSWRGACSCARAWTRRTCRRRPWCPTWSWWPAAGDWCTCWHLEEGEQRWVFHSYYITGGQGREGGQALRLLLRWGEAGRPHPLSWPGQGSLVSLYNTRTHEYWAHTDWGWRWKMGSCQVNTKKMKLSLELQNNLKVKLWSFPKSSI